jgi:hypothetical protein
MSDDEFQPASRPLAEQPGRYQRSTSAMVGALIVTLLVIGAFVAFRALNRTNLDVRPGKVDYLAQVRYAQQAGTDVAYPARLPAGWTATQVTFSAGPPAGIELSMLTSDDAYAGFVQSAESVPELLATYVDPHAAGGGSVTVRGAVASHWSRWTDGSGDTALATQLGHGKEQSSLLVFGTATSAQLEALAASLTTAKLAG